MAHTLDPYKEAPRRFLMNITTRMLHRTDSSDPACEPAPSDVTSYSDSLAFLAKQQITLGGKLMGFSLCPFCQPSEDE